ncbi:hypothetical protein BH24PSE2_BH24PSE2_15490 [soil metagenome]
MTPIYTWSDDKPADDRLRGELRVLRAKLRHEKALDILDRANLAWWVERLLEQDRFLEIVPRRTGRPRDERRHWIAVDYLIRAELAGDGGSEAAARQVAADWGVHERKVYACLEDHRADAEERYESTMRMATAIQHGDRRAALLDFVSSIAAKRMRLLVTADN